MAEVNHSKNIDQRIADAQRKIAAEAKRQQQQRELERAAKRQAAKDAKGKGK